MSQINIFRLCLLSVLFLFSLSNCEKTTNTDKLDELKASISKLAPNADLLKLEKSMTSKLSELQDKIATASSESKSLSNSVKDLNKLSPYLSKLKENFSKLGGQLTKVENDLSTYKKGVDSLKSEIGSKFDPKPVIDDLEKRLSNLQKSVSAMNTKESGPSLSDVKSISTELDSAKKAIADLMKVRENVISEQKKMSEKIEALEKKSGNSDKALNERFEKELSPLKTDAKSFKDEATKKITALEKELKKLKGTTTTGDKSNSQGKVQELEGRINELEDKVKGISSFGIGNMFSETKLWASRFWARHIMDFDISKSYKDLTAFTTEHGGVAIKFIRTKSSEGTERVATFYRTQKPVVEAAALDAYAKALPMAQRAWERSLELSKVAYDKGRFYFETGADIVSHKAREFGVPAQHTDLCAKVVMGAAYSVSAAIILYVFFRIVAFAFSLCCCCRRNNNSKKSSPKNNSSNNSAKKNKKKKKSTKKTA